MTQYPNIRNAKLPLIYKYKIVQKMKSKVLWTEYAILHKNDYNPPKYEEWLEDLVVGLRKELAESKDSIAELNHTVMTLTFKLHSH